MSSDDRTDNTMVVMSTASRSLRRALRPLAWAILEDVALDAVPEDGRLVARTSARQVAERLRVDPGTAAQALRILRERGFLVLEREKGPSGSLWAVGLCDRHNSRPDCHSSERGPPMYGLVTGGLAIGGPAERGASLDGWAAHVRTKQGFSEHGRHGGARVQGHPDVPYFGGEPGPAVHGPDHARLGRGDRVRAARVASPEGWQVSVRRWLIGVGLEMLVNRDWVTGPLAKREMAEGRAVGLFLGVVLGDCCGGRGEQC